LTLQIRQQSWIFVTLEGADWSGTVLNKQIGAYLWRWSSTKCLCACLQGVQLLASSASTLRAPPPLAREVVRFVPADAAGSAVAAAAAGTTAAAGARVRAQPAATHVCRAALLPAAARGAGGGAPLAAPAQQPPPGGGLAPVASRLR